MTNLWDVLAGMSKMHGMFCHGVFCLAPATARSFKLKVTIVLKQSIILHDKQMVGTQCFINTISSLTCFAVGDLYFTHCSH